MANADLANTNLANERCPGCGANLAIVGRRAGKTEGHALQSRISKKIS
jgi:hypothetical protein